MHKVIITLASPPYTVVLHILAISDGEGEARQVVVGVLTLIHTDEEGASLVANLE